MVYDIRTLGIKVVNKTGNEQLCICPFHNDNNPSSWFNTRKGLFYCAVCGEGYTFDRLSEALNVDGSGVVGTYFSEPEPFNLFGVERGIPRGRPDYTEYARQRGISKWYFDKNMESLPNGDVIFKQLDRRHQREGSIVRQLRGNSKYLRFTDLPLWPFHLLPNSIVNKKKIVLVEGMFSAALLNQEIERSEISGIQAFSILGTNHKKLLQFVIDEQCFTFFDGDNAGRSGLLKYRETFPHHYSRMVKTSPDDMNREQLLRMINKILNM